MTGIASRHRGIGVAAFGMTYQQAMSFLSGLVIARVIGAADYGIFTLARNLQMVAGIFARIGLDVGLQRYIGEMGQGTPAQDERLSKVAAFRLAALGASLVFVLAVALGGGAWLEATLYRYPGFAHVLLVTFLALPFLSDIAVLGGVQRGLLQPAPAIVAEYVLMPTIRLVLIVGMFLAGMRLWAVVFGTALAAVASATFFALRYRTCGFRRGNAREGLALPEVRGALRYSLVVACAMGVTQLTRTIDTFFLGHFASAAEVGQYGIAQVMLVLVGLLGAALGQSLGAQVAERAHAGDHAGVERLLEENIRLVALVSCPVFAAFCFWGHELALLFGASFRVPQVVMAMLAAGALVSTLTACAGFALSMTGRHKQELYVLAAGLVVTLVACATLIPRWGLAGAAAATLGSLIAVNAMRLIVVHRATGVFHLRSLHLGIVIGAVLLAWPFSLIPRGEGGQGIFWAASSAGAYLLCYVGCAWFLLGDVGRGQVRDLLTRRGSRER